MPSYLVRPITGEDADKLVALWRRTWAETYGRTLGREAAEIMIASLDANGTTQMMPGTGERGCCALAGAEMIGSAVYVTRENVAYLWGMYVHPDYQRQGVGTKLLQAVIKDLEKGVSLEVRALLSSPYAIAFYAQHGFRVRGEEDLDIFNGLKARASVMALDNQKS